MEAPVINVGIMTHKAISFVFNEEYVHTETGTFTIGEQRALWVNGKMCIRDSDKTNRYPPHT